MSRFLKNVKDLDAFMAAVNQCNGDVYLLSQDKTEQFNLKSRLSSYLALGKLLEDEGENYEVYCQFSTDEGNLLKYFYEREH